MQKIFNINQSNPKVAHNIWVGTKKSTEPSLLLTEASVNLAANEGHTQCCHSEIHDIVDVVLCLDRLVADQFMIIIMYFPPCCALFVFTQIFLRKRSILIFVGMTCAKKIRVLIKSVGTCRSYASKSVLRRQKIFAYRGLFYYEAYTA